MLRIPPFAPLLETASAITTILEQTKTIAGTTIPDDSTPPPTGSEPSALEAYYRNKPNVLDPAIKSTLEPVLEKFKSLENSMLVEGAFRLKLISIQDEYATRILELKDLMFRCLDLMLRCSELNLCDHSAPINSIEEVLDFQTVECSEHIYDYIESRVERLTVNMVPGKAKGLTLLRLCNELLRRLSKAKNTVFCGRILVLLSSVYPLGERSGVNLKGDYNVENITLVESEEVTVVPELAMTPHSQRDGEPEVPSGESMDVDEAPKDDLSTTSRSPRKDAKFYTDFWGLQAFFSNPPLLTNSPQNMEKLRTGVDDTLAKFDAIEEGEVKARHQQSNSDESTSGKPNPTPATSTTVSQTHKDTSQPEKTTSKRKYMTSKARVAPSTYFPKFLTSPKLLGLEIADPYFRKHILVQFLIILQFLEGHTAEAKESWTKVPTPNKSLLPNWVLEDSDRAWVDLVKVKIYKALTALGHACGEDGFVATVQAVISHEQNWIQWKLESCQAFEKKPVASSVMDEAQSKRRKLSESLAPLKQKLGCATLTDLWSTVEEQMDEDTGYGRNRAPRTVDQYISEVSFLAKRAQAMRMRQGKPALSAEETKELEQARLWRALRLGSRQYLHLFGKATSEQAYNITTLAADIKEDERFEDEVRENGGVVPTPAVVETPTLPADANGKVEGGESEPKTAEDQTVKMSDDASTPDAGSPKADAKQKDQGGDVEMKEPDTEASAEIAQEDTGTEVATKD